MPMKTLICLVTDRHPRYLFEAKLRVEGDKRSISPMR